MPPQVEKVDFGSSSFSFDSDDIQSLSFEEGGISSSGKNVTHHDKKLPSSITPSKKSPRGHGQKLPMNEEKDYSEDEEDMEMEDEEKEKQEENKDDTGGRNVRGWI